MARARALRGLSRGLRAIDAGLLGIAMLALVLACAILTGSVLLRYFLHSPTDWQDEASVFLLVGVTFGCGAWVQDRRGHVGIDAIASLLPDGANRVRERIRDALSCAFCGVFAWKSWTLLHEAWEGGFTTSSTWAPPLWIPYSFMAAGMSLLCLRLLVQTLESPGAGDGEADTGTRAQP